MRREENATSRDNNFRMVTIKLNNQLFNLEVDISSLRRALSLPQHDLFHEGIYRQYVHPQLDEDDNIGDVDHVDDDEVVEAPRESGNI